MDKDLKRAKMLIPLVSDGGLTGEERRFLERAVLRYPDLKLEINRHERLHDLLGMVPAVTAPADVERRVLEAIQPQQSPAATGRVIPFSRWRFPVEVAGAVAAAVILVFVVLISYPRLMGTGDKMAALPHDAPGTSTASTIMPDVTPAPTEDVALVPHTGEDRSGDRLLTGAMDDAIHPATGVDKKTFSSEISPFGAVTSAGVTAEKVSKIIIPTHDAPLSTSKREAPMISTTFISSPSEELLIPTILLIYHNDPMKAQKDIMEKAVSLGGTVTRMETEYYKGKDENKTDSDVERIEEENQGEMISLPPEKVDELLDYLVSRYPGIDKEITDIKTNKATLFIRIDVVPTIQ
jgi:hypothetical protein